MVKYFFFNPTCGFPQSIISRQKLKYYRAVLGHYIKYNMTELLRIQVLSPAWLWEEQEHRRYQRTFKRWVATIEALGSVSLRAVVGLV